MKPNQTTISILCFLLIGITTLSAQNSTNTWFFGSKAGVKFSGGSPASLSGNQSDATGGTASISDASGNLLFYSDGEKAYDRFGFVMPNGNALLGDKDGMQTAAIFPVPGSSSKYYLFTAGGVIAYNIIDMNLLGGLGNITSTKNQTLVNSGTSRMCVTKHRNGVDYWVIVSIINTNQYYAYLVTSAGVQSPVISSIGQQVTEEDKKKGTFPAKLRISHDGKLLFSPSYYHNWQLMDFDNCSGDITNDRSFYTLNYVFDAEFSRNNNYLYVSCMSVGAGQSEILQYDVTSGIQPTIDLTQIQIASTVGSFSSIQMGSNDVIYIGNVNTTKLSSISNSNNASPTYTSSAVSLTGTCRNGLPGYPNFNYPGDINIIANINCPDQNSSFTLDCTTGNIQSVSWDFGDPSSANNSGSGISTTHAFSATGTYTVTATMTISGETKVITKVITVSYGVTAAAGNDIEFCSGETGQIGSPTTAGLTYVWSPSTGLSSTTIGNPTVTLTNSGQSDLTFTYTVQVTDPSGKCTSEDEVLVTVKPIPVSTIDQDSLALCPGDIGNITTTSSHSNASFVWTPSTYVSNTTSKDISIESHNFTTNPVIEYYTLTTSLNGCSSEDSIKVIFDPLATIAPVADVVICSGETAPIGVTSEPNYNYLWIPSAGISDPTQSLTTISLINTSSNSLITDYYLVAESEKGCLNVDTAQVTVHPLPIAGDDHYLCPGDTAQLSSSLNGTNYAWTPATNIDDTTIANPKVWPLISTYYYVDIIDVNGCSNFDSVFINVSNAVPVDAGNDTSFCIGDSIQIGGNPTAPIGSFYTWSPATGLSDVSVANPKASPLVTTTYYLFVQNDTCVGRDTIVVTVNPLPAVDAGNDTEICYGLSTTLNATGALNYVWTPNDSLSSDTIFNPIANPLTTTVYYVSGTDTNGCVNSDSIIVAVNPLPLADAGNDTMLCINDTIGLSASGGDSYQWTPGISLNDSTIQSPLTFTKATTNYIVTVTDSKGCEKDDTVIVTVNPLPTINTLNDTTICEGSSIQLQASGGVQYLWWPSDDINSNNISNPIASPTVGTEFFVEVIDANNCVDTADFTVSLNVVPTANFMMEYTAGCEGLRTEFTNSSQNANSYNWNFGDGATSNEEDPEHTFSFDQNATTTLIATSNGICHDTLSASITVENVEFYAKLINGNIITPNGDGKNDCFKIEYSGEFEDCVEIEIYNRWGQKQYNSLDHGDCWDGFNQYNGQKVSEGTYYYVIKIGEYEKRAYVEVR